MLSGEGIAADVVSVPCFELFFEQDEEYIDSIIGGATAKVAVEAAIRQGWDAFVGRKGGFVGMTGFGASGPYKELYDHFGITAKAVADEAKALLG